MNNEENKNSNILIIIILIVTLILCGITSYLAFNLGKESEKTKEPEVTNKTESENKEEKTPEEDNEPEEPKQPVEEDKNVTTNNSGDYSKYIPSGATLYKKDETELTVNGNKHTITHIYSYTFTEKGNSSECGPSDDEDGCAFYSYYLTVLYDGKLTKFSNINLEDRYYHGQNPAVIFDSDSVQFGVIKDSVNNSEYIVMIYMSHFDGGGITITEHETIIIDENYNILYDRKDKTGCDYEKYGSWQNHAELYDNYYNQNYLIILDMKNSYEVKVTMENGKYKEENYEKMDSKNFSGQCPL